MTSSDGLSLDARRQEMDVEGEVSIDAVQYVEDMRVDALEPA